MNNSITMPAENVNNTFPSIESIFSNDEIKQQLDANGLTGLQFDHTSFPTISLKTSFEMSDHPDFDLKSFDVTVMQSLKKVILVDMAEESKKVMTEVKYSRDGQYTTDGEPLDHYVQWISENGGKPKIKRYLDLLVQLHTQDQYHGMIAILSISPTSVSRISGSFYQLSLQGKLNNLNDVLFTVKRGQQRMSKAGVPYYLWAIPLKETLQAAA